MKSDNKAHFFPAALMDGGNELAVKDSRSRKRSSRSRRRTRVRHLFQEFGMLGRKTKGKPSLQDLYGNVFEIIPDTQTQFEPTCAPSAPAIVREAAHIFRWKDSREAANESRSMDFMRKEKEMLFGREHGSEADKAINKIQRNNDMKIASRILVQVRRSNLMENILNQEKNILIKQFFENGFQDPTQAIMETLNEAMEGCYNECMTRQGPHNMVFDDEMRNFLSDKEKAKRVLLDAILKFPEYVPLIWGGRQPAETLKDVIPTDLIVEDLADKSHGSNKQTPNYDKSSKSSEGSQYVSTYVNKQDEKTQARQQTSFDFMSADKQAERNQVKQQASFDFMSADRQARGNQQPGGAGSDSDDETSKSERSDGPNQQKQQILSFDKACRSIMTVIPVEKNVKKFGAFIEQRLPTIPTMHARKEGVQKASKESHERRNAGQVVLKNCNDSQTFVNKAGVEANASVAGKNASTEKSIPRPPAIVAIAAKVGMDEVNEKTAEERAMVVKGAWQSIGILSTIAITDITSSFWAHPREYGR
ncbi:hypothetical protein Y032_0954g3198 [Ancylostoma ceylanicum]|uniref:DUF7774 domain-containing protein n=3 Tax=Ancylostoma ceylanicum TaxID=53326 RepID=A0A016W8L3_9BILA|nr:hypothetical protein Y032_0954g3198 [Ancylostoma ceylanicum]